MAALILLFVLFTVGYLFGPVQNYVGPPQGPDRGTETH